jgi:hypothetical protein
MGFVGMLFWVLVLWFMIRALRRSQRCVPVGPGGQWSEWTGREPYRAVDVPRPRTRPDDQEYIDSLESRISELEERLDFTERLLASRAEK